MCKAKGFKEMAKDSTSSDVDGTRPMAVIAYFNKNPAN